MDTLGAMAPGAMGAWVHGGHGWSGGRAEQAEWGGAGGHALGPCLLIGSRGIGDHGAKGPGATKSRGLAVMEGGWSGGRAEQAERAGMRWSPLKSFDL